jgi:hypothetical protein
MPTVYVCICGDEFPRFYRLERHICQCVEHEPGRHKYDYSYRV